MGGLTSFDNTPPPPYALQMCVCACVCVYCHPIYSGCQVCGRTSRGHTGFLRLPSAVLAVYNLNSGGRLFLRNIAQSGLIID